MPPNNAANKMVWFTAGCNDCRLLLLSAKHSHKLRCIISKDFNPQLDVLNLHPLHRMSARLYSVHTWSYQCSTLWLLANASTAGMQIVATAKAVAESEGFQSNDVIPTSLVAIPKKNMAGRRLTADFLQRGCLFSITQNSYHSCT